MSNPASLWSPRKASLVRWGPRSKCPKCGVSCRAARLQEHVESCDGQPVKKYAHGHSKCACGLMKRQDSPYCFRCSGVDLDSIVLAGRPQASPRDLICYSTRRDGTSGGSPENWEKSL